jgi:hypothetical protein
MELAAGTFCKHVQGQQTKVYFCCFVWIQRVSGTRAPLRGWGGGCVSTGVTVMELAAGTFCKHVQGQQTKVYFCCFLWIPCRPPTGVGVVVVLLVPQWMAAPPPPTYKGWLCFVMKSFIVSECGMYLSLAVVSHVA